VYKLSGDFQDLDPSVFFAILDDLKKTDRYIWNYDISSHFITFGRDDDNSYYLVTHASAAEFKKQLD
jgi:hypothetical protein